MIYAIYSVVIFFSTLLGAFVGLGGGVIIKPVFDFIGYHSVSQIALFSASAVFTMSVSSTFKHIKNKTPISYKIILLFSIGSVLGGIAGNRLFNSALSYANSSDFVKGIQSAALTLLLLFVVVSVNINVKHFKIENPAAICFTGFLLGLTAAFLGIGGGPINVAVLTILFSFTMRDAAVYSVAIILFSQLSNLITIYVNTGFKGYDLKYLAVIIPFSVLGGIFGAILNRKCEDKTIKTAFTVFVSCVICLSLYNCISAFNGGAL